MTDTRAAKDGNLRRVAGDFVTDDGGGKQQSDFNFVRGCKNIQDAFYDSPRSRAYTSLFH
jgi:hypothetical protein